MKIMGSLPLKNLRDPRVVANARRSVTVLFVDPLVLLTNSLRCPLLLDRHVPPRQPHPDLVAVCFVGEMAAISGKGLGMVGRHDEIVREVARLESERHPRWVFWSCLLYTS